MVIPENREMFAGKNKYEINHGGISIDEMVVPFVKLVKAIEYVRIRQAIKTGMDIQITQIS